MKKNKKEQKVITNSLIMGLTFGLIASIIVSLGCGSVFEGFGANLSAFNGAMIIFPLVFISNLVTLMMYFVFNVINNKNKK